MPPRESPSLVPQFPRRAAGWVVRGTATLTFGWVAGKSPRLLCATRDRDTARAGTGSPRGYGQGTPAGTRDPQNVPLPVFQGSPTTSRPQPLGCQGVPEAGDCTLPGAVPGCPSFPPALGSFPGGKFHQTQSFPRGKRGLGPPRARPPAPAPLGTSAQCCTCRALPQPCQEGPGHQGHLSQPCRVGGTQPGGPHAGGQWGHRQPERWHPSPCGASCWEPGRCRWRWG